MFKIADTDLRVPTIAVCALLCAGPVAAEIANPVQATATPFALFFAAGSVLVVLVVLLTVAGLWTLLQALRAQRGTPLPLWPLLLIAGLLVLLTAGLLAFPAFLVMFWPALLGVILIWHLHEWRKGNRGLWSDTKREGVMTLGLLGIAVWQAIPALALAAQIAQVAVPPLDRGEPPFRHRRERTVPERPLSLTTRSPSCGFPILSPVCNPAPRPTVPRDSPGWIGIASRPTPKPRSACSAFSPRCPMA
jgi:hypothetical protein